MALAQRKPRTDPHGHDQPRIAPPVPARSEWKAFREIADKIGISLFPWQETASRYLTALGAGDHPLYREVAVIVARQNGKTTLLLPLVIGRLLKGRRVTHAAQHLRVTGEFHMELADIVQKHFSEYLPARRGISWRAGQEEIRFTTGGVYQIVAASKGAPRGPANELVIIDELREMEDNRFLAAIKPTIVAQRDGQVVYASNAGSESSVVLNGVKARAIEDPTLAYLEWSSDPEYAADNEAGWLQANPSVGHKDGLLENLRSEYHASRLAGTMAEFETEYLCRWVTTIRAPLVDSEAWQRCVAQELVPGRAVYMGVSMDPEGKRGSAALAWRQPDGTFALRALLEGTGDPIGPSEFGKDLRKLAIANRVMKTAFDPVSDREIAKYLPKSEAISGQHFSNASATFRRVVHSNQLRHMSADAITDDLNWTTRKDHEESGSFQAVRADEERPITAVLAAIRAVWLASGPPPTEAKVY